VGPESDCESEISVCFERGVTKRERERERERERGREVGQ
jgi:hypothetical protein